MEFVAQNETKNRRNFPSAAVFHMVQWLENNLNEPYPRKEDMERLKELTGLSQTQIANWFANARRRFMKDQNILQRRRHNSYESVIFFSKPTLNYSKKISSLSSTTTSTTSTTTNSNTTNSTQNPSSPSQSPSSSSIYSSPSFTCPSSPSFSSPSSSGSTSPTHTQNQAFSPSFFSAPVSAPSSPVFHSPEMTMMQQGSPYMPSSMPMPMPLPLSVSESMVPVDRRRSAPDCLVAPLSSLSVLPLPPRPQSLPSMFDDDEEEVVEENEAKSRGEGRKVQLPSMPCLLSVVEKSISQSHSPSHSHHFPSSRLLPPLPSIPPFPAAALSPAPPPPSVPAPAPPSPPSSTPTSTIVEQHSSKTSPSSGRVYYF